MATPPIPAATLADVERHLRAGRSVRAAAAACGVSVGTAARVRRQVLAGGGPIPAGQPDPDPAGEPDAVVREAADGTATVTIHTARPVRTLADAVRAAEVDETVWAVDRWECAQWTVPMKVEQGQDAGGRWKAAAPIVTQQYRVKVFLRRLLPRATRAALDLVFAGFRDAAPRWPALPAPRAGKAEPFLAVFGLFDAHFGKLCWAPETGEHYDLAIAEAVLRHAVEDLLAEAAHRPLAKILLPLGNDWFHIDTRANATTRGTPQDVDGRFSKVLATGIRAAVGAVEAMAAAAPVEVVLVPGNHDRTLSECLCHVLAARFHRTDRVAVDVSPRTRKYHRFGATLLGLAHGDLVKPKDLPALMPADAKRDWADTATHEWLTGHGHRSQKWTTLDTDTQQGTVVRQLRALTRTDLWHFDMGYCGQSPAAEVYFYGRDRGYAGHAVVPTRAG